MAVNGIICRLCHAKMALEPLMLDVVHDGTIVPVKIEQAHVCKACPHVVLYSHQVALVNGTVAKAHKNRRSGA